MIGTVVRIQADYYAVWIEDREAVCRRRGKLIKAGMEIRVGDRVRLDGEAIEEVLERRNLLVRPYVANVDQVLVVMAADSPPFDPVKLDQFLILADQSGVPALLVINKIDQGDPDVIAQWERLYAGIGYPVVLTSASQGRGMDRLAEQLAHRTSVLAGPSGVGKSSLLNALQPGLALAEGEVSEIGRGRHTTRHVALYPVAEGLVADTPGFSLMEFSKIPPRELANHFQEFRPRIAECRFSSCLHRDEPDCAVRAHFEQSPRYQSYLKLLAELDGPLFFATGSTKQETKVKASGKKSLIKIGAEQREASRRQARQDLTQLPLDEEEDDEN